MNNRGVTIAIAALLCAGLAACASQSVRKVNATTPIQATQAIPEAELLDVNIGVFDPGVPDDPAKAEEERIVPAVRKAESRYMPFTLKKTLQGTGQWGAVRVVPAGEAAADVMVMGRIVQSDGETLTLDIQVQDSAGRQWLDKRYTGKASKYAYNEKSTANMDPFQDVYDTIANDMVMARRDLTHAEREKLRTISKLKFAAELAPYAYGDYLDKTKKGRYKIQRLPAEDDPMLVRIEKVRQRDHLFVDTLDQHYANFYSDLNGPYRDWRKSSYNETVALRELQSSAWKRILLGAGAVVGGIVLAGSTNSGVAGAAGTAAVLGGAGAIKSGIDKRSESKIHADALRELDQSFKAQVQPQVVDLEGKTVTLSGSAEEQYKEWRELLKKIYVSETGFKLQDADDSATTQGDKQPEPQ